MNHNLMGNSNERSYKKRFPLHDAVLHDNVESVKLLLEKGANIDTLNDDGETPIHMLCSLSYPQYNLEMIELLLEKGANTEVIYTCKNLRYSSMTMCVCDIKQFFHSSTAVCGISSCLCTKEDDFVDGPLHMACLFDDFELCKLLLKNGANVNSIGDNGNTPLHELCTDYDESEVNLKDRLKIINLFLESGANIKALNFEYESPLDYARSSDRIFYVKVFKILEEHVSQKILHLFFKIISAKNIANKLRIEPHNLFDPEFSGLRKRILKIDDSRFLKE